MKRMTIAVLAVVVLSGCAAMQATLQNMTPAQRIKYQINVAYTVANSAISLARIFVSNQEDLVEIQTKIQEITVVLNAQIDIILALIPGDMPGVEEYAQEKIDALNVSMDALESIATSENIPELEPL